MCIFLYHIVVVRNDDIKYQVYQVSRDLFDELITGEVIGNDGLMRRISYLVVLLQNTVHDGNDLLNVEPRPRVLCMMVIIPILIVMFMILFTRKIYYIVVLVQSLLTLHPGDGFQQLQPVQLVVIVSVVLPEVLHQQLGVVQAVDIHVLLLDLSLDVPERL